MKNKVIDKKHFRNRGNLRGLVNKVGKFLKKFMVMFLRPLKPSRWFVFQQILSAFNHVIPKTCKLYNL